MALRPAQVHAQEHLRPVSSVDAAGLGADGDDGVTLVVFARQQRAHLEGVDLFAEIAEFGFGLAETGGVTLGLGQLVKHPEVVKPLAQLGDTAQLALPMGQLAGHLLRRLGVVPEVRA